jgi:GNAT superfamily N-acetyltransferase
MKHNIYVVSATDIKNMRNNILQHMIFKNFKHLADIPSLKHNMIEIDRLIRGNQSIIYLYMIDNQIASYVVGEILEVSGRKVYYVTYLYTSDKYRNSGLASKLIKFIEKNASNLNLNGIMLTTNTENKKVYDFYLKRGFMPDLLLRTYSKYDVLYKPVW